MQWQGELGQLSGTDGVGKGLKRMNGHCGLAGNWIAERDCCKQNRIAAGVDRTKKKLTEACWIVLAWAQAEIRMDGGMHMDLYFRRHVVADPRVPRGP